MHRGEEVISRDKLSPEALDLVPLRMPGRSLSTVSSRKAELSGLWGLHGSHLGVGAGGKVLLH